MKSSLGGRWTDEDITACYNLAMTTDSRVLQTIIDCHQLSVNPALKMVKTQFFDQVAGLNYEYQDARCALMVRQYNSKSNPKVRQGKMFIAAEVTEKMVAELAKPANLEIMAKSDAFLKDMMTHYDIDALMRDPALSGPVMKVKTQVLVRVGGLMMGLKVVDVASGLPKVEAKLVLHLKPSLSTEQVENLPALVFAEAQQFLDEDRKAEAKKKAADSPQEDRSEGLKPLTLSAPLEFNPEGRVEETLEIKASKEKFSIGMTIELAKKVKNVGVAGREGSIKGFLEKTVKGVKQLQATVVWSDDAEGEDGVLEKESQLALSQLRFAGPAKKKAKTEEPQVQKTAIPKESIPFEFYGASTAMNACMAMAKQELWQMYLRMASSLTDKLEIRGAVDEQNKVSESKVVIVAKEFFAKGNLCLVPFSPANFVDKEPTHQKAVPVQFKLGEHTEDFWIPFNGSIAWDKEKSILSPYWAVGFVKDGYDDKANMVLKKVEVKLGVPGKIENPDFSHLQAPVSRQDRGTFSFQVLVNKGQVKEGDPLWRS